MLGSAQHPAVITLMRLIGTQSLETFTRWALEQAAARAVVTACGVFRTPTNALEYMFYGAAAIAYSQAGPEASPAAYDALADQELRRLLASLAAAAVEIEAHPVKIDWNC